jgi:uncharacterized protein YkwD
MKTGSPELTQNENLTEIARLKARDMVEYGYFSEDDSPIYGTANEMIAEYYGKSNKNYARVIRNCNTAEEVISSGVLYPSTSKLTEIGIGGAQAANGVMHWAVIGVIGINPLDEAAKTTAEETAKTEVVKAAEPVFEEATLPTRDEIVQSEFVEAAEPVFDEAAQTAFEEATLPARDEIAQPEFVAAAEPVFDEAAQTVFEDEAIRLINEERTKAGLKTVAKNDGLSKVARLKAQNMSDNGYFSHKSPIYGYPDEMVKELLGITASVGENAAKGYDTP